MKTQIPTMQDVKKDFISQIAELKACNLDDYILAYPDTGISIKFNGNKPDTCNAADATEVANDKMPEEAWSYIPSVSNGRGEKAKVIRRQAMIKIDIERLETHLTHPMFN